MPFYNVIFEPMANTVEFKIAKRSTASSKGEFTPFVDYKVIHQNLRKEYKMYLTLHENAQKIFNPFCEKDSLHAMCFYQIKRNLRILKEKLHHFNEDVQKKYHTEYEEDCFYMDEKFISDVETSIYDEDYSKYVARKTDKRPKKLRFDFDDEW